MLTAVPHSTAPRSRWTFSASTAEAPPGAADAVTSWTALPGGVVDGGEIVVLAIKPSMWKPALESAPWLVVAAVAAGFVASLRLPLPGLSIVGTIQILLLVGFARLGFSIARWIPTWHVLTNRRIIDVHGVRKPVIASCALVDIRNTFVQKGVAEQLLRLGSIAFSTMPACDRPIYWRTIADPDAVHAHIRRAIENALDQQGM